MPMETSQVWKGNRQEWINKVQYRNVGGVGELTTQRTSLNSSSSIVHTFRRMRYVE